jgi:hypothetical protein
MPLKLVAAICLIAEDVALKLNNGQRRIVVLNAMR